MSHSLRPHGLQHERLPCPSLSPGVCSNSCLLNLWCHPTISSSVTLFSSCLQSFLTSGSFPMSQVFSSGCQSIGVSVSASVLPVDIQDWFLLELTGVIFLPPQAPWFESISSLVLSLLYGPTLTSLHDYWKNHSFAYMDFCQQSDISAF